MGILLRPEDFSNPPTTFSRANLKLLSHKPVLKDFPPEGIPSVELVSDQSVFGGDYWRHHQTVVDAPKDGIPTTAYIWDTDTRWFPINVYDNVAGAFPMAPTETSHIFWERPLPYVKTKLIGQERFASEALMVGYPLSWFRDITEKDLRFERHNPYLTYASGEIYRKPRVFPDFVHARMNNSKTRMNFDFSLILLAMADTAFGRKVSTTAWAWGILHFFMHDSSPQEQAAALKTMFTHVRKHNFPIALSTARAWIRPISVEALPELSRLRKDTVPEILTRCPAELLRDLRKDDAFAAWLFRFPRADDQLGALLKEPPPTQQMYDLAALRQCAQAFLSVRGSGLKKNEKLSKELMSDVFLGVRDRLRQRFADLSLSGAMLACAGEWLTYLSSASIEVEPGFTLPL